MGDEQQDTHLTWQEQLAELRAQVAADREAIEALQAGARQASGQAVAGAFLLEAHSTRLDDLEDRADAARDVPFVNQYWAGRDLGQEHTQQLQQALHASRTFNIAVGIIMANRAISEPEAVAILTTASRDQHRKLQDVAEEVLVSGDAAVLPAV